jgi:undecaprenyl pyrophosphate phosphatase UppP
VFSGLDRKTALSFSFLSGIPLLAASGLYSLFKLGFTESLSGSEWSLIIIATMTSFVFGILAALLLRRYIERSILTICGIYRIALSLGLMLILYVL